jgi:hypothetical protein
MSDKSSDQIVIKIKQRPWYEWVAWAVWLLAELFLLQNAIASHQELEPRAATIFWVMFGVLLLAGLIVWFTRRVKSDETDSAAAG